MPFSPASHCPNPAFLHGSSAEVGWTSVLLERHRLGGAVEYEARITPDPCVFVLTSGQMDLAARTGRAWERWAFDVGTAGVLPGDLELSLRLATARAETPFEIAQLFLPRQILEEAADHYRAAGEAVPVVTPIALGFRDPTVVDAVHGLLRAMADGAPDLYADTFAHALATHLLSQHVPWRRGTTLERSPGGLPDARLARVLEYMSVHFAEALDLERLAREAGVSKFHFARLFRAATGTTPHRHLVELRLVAAQRMLTGTGRTVAEVAFACGYENAAHFGAAFQRRHGVSPGAFRQRARS